MPTRALHVEADHGRPAGGRTGGLLDGRRSAVPAARAGRRGTLLRAKLRGFSQVPPVLSPATGRFVARLSEDAIEYELTYRNLSSDAFAAHMHFGHPTDNGGILVFLCGGTDKPACPLRGGTVRGTIRAADVLAIPEQGVAAGDGSALLRIIRAGLAYVNVHTQNFPDGEIRGQIR